MPTYLGNPSLSNAVKDRVISTFQQTLSLYKQGRAEEVLSGCNLMLQMDPMFDPARKLMEKTRNPNLPIDVDTLLPNSDDEALREARTAMAQRDFSRVVQITTEILTNDLMNDAARILADEARDKMEAAPFVEQFVAKCEKSITAGDLTGAKASLEKARALDAEHPAIAKMAQMIASKSGGAPAAPKPAASPAFDFGTSFVVDAPPAVPGRGTAQATDFGFTFEEEKAPPPADGGLTGFSFDQPAAAPAPPPPSKPTPPPAAPPASSGNFSFGGTSSDAPFAGFSFDNPSPAPTPASGGFSFDASGAAKAPVSGDFDFATASIETSAEDQRKMDQYLTDGDRAFEAADYQKAIDLWSRIFLIDVTNEAASERIERAKQKRKEIEQKNESIVATAIAAFDRNDREGAREKFAEVLRNEPNNITAQDYMERLNEGSAPVEEAAPAFDTPYRAPAEEKFDIFADEPASGDMPLMPPDPGEEADESIVPTTKKGAKKTGGITKAKPAKVSKPLPMGLIATVLGVILVVGGGYFGYTKFMTKPPADAATGDATIKQAQSLAAQGKFDQAISILQDIKQDDPQHDKALLMIADFQKKRAQASEMIEGRPAALVFQEGLANGKTQYDSHDYDGAKKAFELAMRVKPLPPDMKAMYDDASQKVAKLDSAKSLFNEHKYADALANLQQLQATDPQNKNIVRLIEDAHFNLGAVALQNEQLSDAVQHFDEVLKIDPADDLAKRSKELAIRYQTEPKDLLYKIYVKYLPLRQAS
ncbi:MAG TPA: tetratricopeptide repeat protein [Thermoanaerobaculia bacterium]|nr:tetratricopeptide repeat protein [Thermoanaerobaculia bacterium]